MLKKTDYNTKITEIENKLNHNHDKYITTPEFNAFAADVFNGRLAQANLVTTTIFDNIVSSLDGKTESTKTLNTSLENLLKRIRKKLDLGNFIGKNYFEDGTQNYLVFQPINRYFKHIANTLYILSWKSKGLTDKTIKPPVTPDKS